MKKIYLTQGKAALVDEVDWQRLCRWTWFARYSSKTKTWYALRSVNTGSRIVTVYMSRVILGLTDSKVFAEHKNGDTLDNRRENLRIATYLQNRMNARRPITNVSGFKGVSFRKNIKTKPWRATISAGGKKLSLGSFATPEEAAAVYQQKAVELYGEFVRLDKLG